MAGALGAGNVAAQQRGFDHAKHARVFPSCTTCHAGIVVQGAALWPAPASCASCHDGKVQKQVQWQPPAEPGRYNVRFDHATHAATAANRPTTCVACHADAGAPWMTVRPPVPERCLDCHGVRTAHLAAPDTACATCHLPLAQAKRLTVRDVAAFAAPPDHGQPGFGGATGHGAAAQRGAPVAASCAICHARDFCLQCHVDAPDQATIQALAPDPRSRAITAHLTAPVSHTNPAFLTTHGGVARHAAQQCKFPPPREAVSQVTPAGPGSPPSPRPRAAGAAPGRHRPGGHRRHMARPSSSDRGG
jgi:hypothetical protein